MKKLISVIIVIAMISASIAGAAITNAVVESTELELGAEFAPTDINNGTIAGAYYKAAIEPEETLPDSDIPIDNPQDKLRITIDSVEAEPGSEVDVNIKLTNNTGINALRMELHYGDLEFVNVNFPIWNADDESMIMSYNNEFDQAMIRLNWVSSVNVVSGDVTYATVTFKVPDYAAKNTVYNLTADIDPENVFDVDMNNIPFELVYGSVTVSSAPDTYIRHSLDSIRIENEKKYDVDTVTMKRGSAISILGWVVFSDGLKEMFYTVDGEEYACEDVYRDRPDVVYHYNYPDEYGIHAGFGLGSDYMGLLGIYSLNPGTYTVEIGARSNGGAEIILKTFTLEVIDETDPAIDIGTYIADSGVNLSGDFLPVSSNTYAVMQGSPVAIQGWAIFSDNLKEVYYTLDGEECACEDIYRDIPSDKINDYGFPAEYCTHAGFGVDSNPMDLIGIDSLNAGTYEILIIARAYGGTERVLYTFTLEVLDANTPRLQRYTVDNFWVDGIQKHKNDMPTIGYFRNIGIRGWVIIFNGVIDQFGYRIDDGESIFSESYLEDRADVRTVYNVSSDIANGFNINSVDITSLENGNHTVTVQVQTVSGSILEVTTIPLKIDSSGQIQIGSYGSGPVQFVNTCFDHGTVENKTHVKAAGWTGANYPVTRFGYSIDGGDPIFSGVTLTEVGANDPIKYQSNGGRYGVMFSIDVDFKDAGLDPCVHNIKIVAEFDDDSKTVLELDNVTSGIKNSFDIIIESGEPQYDPELSVAGCNLSFESSIYIKYAVKCNDLSKVKLLIWTEPQTLYEYGSQKYILEAVGTEKVSGVKCAIFQYDKLAAKQMGDVIYARAVVENEGEYYYSNLKKYSVLQYVYNKTGRTGTASSNQKLIDLLNAMLDYGAKAQIYFNYKTDRLVTSDYYQVSAVGGLLPDGCTSGLYALGETLTLTAPSVNENGDAFSYWENDVGEVVGTTESITVTVVSLNRKYTAIYGAGLAYSDNGDGTCTITGIGTYFGNVVDIPSEIDGLTVNAIGEKAFENQTSLTGINLPDTIKTIGRRAFYGCTGLTEFTIPNSVTSIGTQIFYKADNIETVYYNSDYYPSTETENQFLNNSSIKKIVFGGTYIGNYAARNLGITGNVNTVEISNSVTSIKDYAFYAHTRLSGVVINDSVTSIGGSAFSGCTSLASVTIPNSVTSIGGSAFSGCTNLTSITLPNKLEYIANSLFAGCSSVKNITIPYSVTSIRDYAFRDCTSLKSIMIPDNVTSIDDYAFYACTSLANVYYNGDLEEWLEISFSYYSSNPCCYGANLYIDGELLTDAIIPDSVTGICGYAFYGCTSLTSITIPDSVTSIGEYAFKDCTSLASISIPDSVTSIESSAFYGCTSLTSITIPNSVTSIGYAAFSGCTSLASITIPDSVTSINDSAFYGCTSLTSVVINDGVTSIGHAVFYGCTSLTSVTIPDSVTSIGDRAFYLCTSLNNVYFNGTLEKWLEISFYNAESHPCYKGANLYIDGELLTDAIIRDSVRGISKYAFYGCISLTSVTIPDSVTSIGEQAFRKCTSLTSITIPDSVTSIGSSAFYGCTSLTNITIPGSVTSIGYDAFESCINLTDVYYSGDLEEWLGISFGYCSSNPCCYGANLYIDGELLTNAIIRDSVRGISKYAFCGCTSLTSVTIPDSVTSIGDQAFRDCTSLTSITIPDSVTSIGYYAFKYCRNLTDVYYNGTSEQWNSITISSGNEYLTSAALHCLGDE